MKISMLVFDLSDNCLVRTYPIAKVLEKHYEVEIIGPIFGDGIFKPYADEFNYKPVIGRNYPFFASSIRQILNEIEGDVVYAFKPRPTSFGIGLIEKLRNKKPLFLDIEDWEYGSELNYSRWKLPFRYVSTLGNPNGVLATYLMEHLTMFADEVFVVSDFLQRRFGGVKLPHGADTNVFDPSKHNGDGIREEFGLNDEKVILFAGTPRPHKGLEDLILALRDIDRKDVKLLIVGGNLKDLYIQKLLQINKDSIIVTGYQPHTKMPEFLSMADIVVLPQRKTLNAMAQIPGKIFEAMAMAKPIVATRISDIPEILDGCGLIVESENIDELSTAIKYVLENKNAALELGTKAREKCIEKYSWDAMEKTLLTVFRGYDL